MVRNFIGRVAGLPASLGIAMVAAVVSLPFARLDFDPHHDGVMVAAAVAVRDGLVVQKDVFAQYGPITPLLQGWVLKLGLDPTLGIRLLNVLAIALVAFAIADVGRKMPDFWPISLSAGRWASLAWLVVADYFLWVPQLPWSSTIEAALTALALLLVGRTLTARLGGGRIPWQVSAVAAGALMAVLPFARLNVGLATAVACAAVTFLAVMLVPEVRSMAWWLAGSWLATTGVVAALLLWSGALVQWWQQAIVWPLSWASEVGSQLGPDLLLQEITKAFWPGLVAVGVIVAFTPWRVGSRQRTRGWLAVLSVVTAVGLVLALYRNPSLNRIFLADQRGIRESFVDGLTRGSLVFLTFLCAVVIVVAVIRGVQMATSLTKAGTYRPEPLAWLVVIGFALGGLVQYAPVPDSRHIWWGLPIGMSLVFASLGRSRLWSPTHNPLVLALAAAAVAALISGRAYVVYERVPGPAGSVAAGMLSQTDVAERIEASVEVLRANVGESEAVFLVAEGAWSVFDSNYHSPDRHFVDWGASFDLEQRLSQVQWAVTDSLSADRFGETLEGTGFRVVDEGGGLQVWVPAG